MHSGKPPLWTPPPRPRQLNPDTGNFFRDPNAARFPKYPTEPAVQAVLTQNPDIDVGDIDVFACGSTMGNLLRFARNIDKGFRFNVELIGNTVFFIRKESSPTALIEDVRGFGHTFPEAYTTWEPDVKRSASHQRVIKYEFAGLSCLVRYGCDGYHKDLVTERDRAESKPVSRTPTNIVDEVGALSVGMGAQTNMSDANASLEIMKAGSPVPQNAVFDIKTKHGKYPIDMAEIFPRLWVCQVPNLILAYHDRGIFSDIRKQDLRSEISKWEENKEEALSKLALLMQKIVAFAKVHSDVKLEIVRNEGADLEIREQADQGNDGLSQTSKARWTAHLDISPTESFKPGHEGGLEDDEEEPDYTACSEEECGYCGRCTY
jgi:hypothetical protein